VNIKTSRQLMSVNAKKFPAHSFDAVSGNCRPYLFGGGNADPGLGMLGWCVNKNKKLADESLPVLSQSQIFGAFEDTAVFRQSLSQKSSPRPSPSGPHRY
jgi:hypothetical protein